MASRITSRHHFMHVSVVEIRPIMNIFIVPRWNQNIRPDVIIRAPKAAVRGQGL